MRLSEYFNRKPNKVSSINVKNNGRTKSKKLYSFLETKHQETSSFGYQWNRYRNLQIDRFNGHKMSESFLLDMLGFSLSKLKNKSVLEIGSGAGRFTDILKDYAKIVITLDPSDAIKANVAASANNVILIQADLFDLPIKSEKIDLVYCRGVIQHTKDPKLAIKKLLGYVKPGGLVVFDVYPKTWRNIFMTKYYLRPITKRINKVKFARLLEKNIPWILYFKVNFLNKIFPQVRYIKDIPDIIVPIVDYTRWWKDLSWDQYVKLGILDTFDMYSPEFDTPLTFNEILDQVKSKDYQVEYASEDWFRFRIRKIK